MYLSVNIFKNRWWQISMPDWFVHVLYTVVVASACCVSCWHSLCCSKCCDLLRIYPCKSIGKWRWTLSWFAVISIFHSTPPLLQRLAEVAHSLLKLAPYDPPTLGCKGLRTYMTEMLPLTDWSVEAVRPSINLVLRRLDRMFNKIYKQTSLRWGWGGVRIEGATG